LLLEHSNVSLPAGIPSARRHRVFCLGCGEPLQERASRLDWKVIGEREQVLVAGNEDGALLLGERDQVVVAGVNGSARRIWWSRRRPRSPAQERDECSGFLRGDAAASLRVGECALEF